MDQLLAFFNSSFFSAIVTIIVGAAAFIIYFWQKRDHKREAANILLLEIQGAERSLSKVQESLASNELASDAFLMPTESWTKYKYLFLSNFDRDEWDSIANFYERCRLIDDDIRFNNSGFWNDVQEIRANKQRVLADYSKDTAEKILKEKDPDKQSSLQEEFDKVTAKFDEIYMQKQMQFGYAPQKPVNDAKNHILGLFSNLSQTAVGSKLKKLAGI